MERKKNTLDIYSRIKIYKKILSKLLSIDFIGPA